MSPNVDDNAGPTGPSAGNTDANAADSPDSKYRTPLARAPTKAQTRRSAQIEKAEISRKRGVRSGTLTIA